MDAALPIVKVESDQHMIWGWANVATKDGLPVVDRQGDVVDIEDLRKAAHSFMEKSRNSGEMHEIMGVGRVVESVVLDKALQDALGIDLGKEGWFIGVKVTSPRVWKRVKSGELASFSIGGQGRRTQLTAAHKIMLGLQKQIGGIVKRGNPNHDDHGRFASTNTAHGRATATQRAHHVASRSIEETMRHVREREAHDNEEKARIAAETDAQIAQQKPKQPSKQPSTATTAHESLFDKDGVVVSDPNIHGPAAHMQENVRVQALAASHPVADPFKGSTLDAIKMAYGKYETGKPVDMPYLHTFTKAPNMGTMYGQQIEPKGQYLYPGEIEGLAGMAHAQYSGDIESGIMHFKNPIVIKFKNTRSDGWKKDLSEAYGGRTGRALANAIIQSGHDGIITLQDSIGFDKYSDMGAPTGWPQEAVNLTAQRTLVQSRKNNRVSAVNPVTMNQFTALVQGGNFPPGGYEKDVAALHQRLMNSSFHKFNIHHDAKGRFATIEGAQAAVVSPALRQQATTQGGLSVDFTGRKTIYDDPVIMAGRLLDERTPPTNMIDTPERRHLRRQIEEKLYGNGAAKKEKRVDFVLGRPGAGKSTGIVNQLVKDHGALVIDADDAKRELPEYSDPHYNIPNHVGTVAGALHEESTDISNAVAEHAIRKGDNIVIPMLGKSLDSLNAKIDKFRKLGYQVHMHLVDAPMGVTIPRTIKRWHDGRQGMVDPAYQLVVGDKPIHNFLKLQRDPRLAETTFISTDVPHGQQPVLIDHWVNPSIEPTSALRHHHTEPAQKSGGHGATGTETRQDAGQADSGAGSWTRHFQRLDVGQSDGVAKHNPNHDERGRFATSDAAVDTGTTPEAFIPQEALSAGAHGYVPESDHASPREIRALNADVEQSLIDPATGKDAVSEAVERFGGGSSTVTAKTPGAGVFEGRMTPNTIIHFDPNTSDDALSETAALRGLLLGQEAQVWSRRVSQNDTTAGVGYIVHAGAPDAVQPLSSSSYAALHAIIASDPELKPLDGSTFKDGTILFRNFGDTPEPEYQRLLNVATEKLSHDYGIETHIGQARYHGEYLPYESYLSHVGQHPDTLRWAADYLETTTGPAYLRHARQIGADENEVAARIHLHAAALRDAANMMTHHAEVAKFNPHHGQHGQFSSTSAALASYNVINDKSRREQTIEGAKRSLRAARMAQATYLAHGDKQMAEAFGAMATAHEKRIARMKAGGPYMAPPNHVKYQTTDVSRMSPERRREHELAQALNALNAPGAKIPASLLTHPERNHIEV